MYKCKAFFLINSSNSFQPHWDLSEGGGVFNFSRVPRHSAGGTYVRMSSEARTATTWMHVRATHPQTNSEKVMLACSVLRQIITRWSVREQAREIARTQLAIARSQSETPGTNQEESLKCWRGIRDASRETAREPKQQRQARQEADKQCTQR